MSILTESSKPLINTDLAFKAPQRIWIPTNKKGEPLVEFDVTDYKIVAPPHPLKITWTQDVETEVTSGYMPYIYSTNAHGKLTLEAADSIYQSRYFRKCHELIQADLEKKYRERRRLDKFLEQVSKIKF